MTPNGTTAKPPSPPLPHSINRMHRCWVGIDGTRTGWVVFVILDTDDYEVWHVSRLTDVEQLTHRLAIQAIALDIPLGLLTCAQRGGRGCDREARRLLSLARRGEARTQKRLSLVGSSSIFTPPSRPALAAFCNGATHAQVSEANRQSAKQSSCLADCSGTGLGLSIQSYHILTKINEADLFVSSGDLLVSPCKQRTAQSLSTRVATLECHPELAFLALLSQGAAQGGQRLDLRDVTALWSKKVQEGRRQRLELVCQKGALDPAKLLSLAQSEGRQSTGGLCKSLNTLSQLRTWRIRDIAADKGSTMSVAADDVLDAMICAITSRKWSSGHARVVREGEEEYDERGLPMLIWS